jgi:hypothetical protein
MPINLLSAGGGTTTLTTESSASNFTVTIPASTGTMVTTAATQTLTNKTLTSPAISSPTISGTPVMQASVVTRATAVASTSGTSIDFTGIPSWVKRITVMFNGVSTNGTSRILVQIGSGSFAITGYISTGIRVTSGNATAAASSTAGMIILQELASDILSGSMVLTNITGNTWINNHTAKKATSNSVFGGGDVALDGVLDRVRITTVNGTDTFDAGSINILYE